MKPNNDLSLYENLNSNLINDLNIRPKILKLIYKKCRVHPPI